MRHMNIQNRKMFCYLLYFRLTGDEKHYHRAVKFAEFIVSREFAGYLEKPDSPYSLYEGLAGTACFLIDILQPQKASFPLYDINVA